MRLYKEKVKFEWKMAFLSAFVIGLLVHMYKFTNTLLNQDSLFNFYNDQNIVGSGRWFLSIACGISSYFDLPWINGLLSVLYISLTAVVITDVFALKNPVVIILSSGVLSAFPGIIQTFFYGFTADGYMLAMLLSALSVSVYRIDENRISCLVLSALLICLSCAIYQAYVSFALVFLLSYVMLDMLDVRRTSEKYLCYLFRQALIYVLAMAAYYIIWKVCMKMQGIEANDYQGIKELSELSGLSISLSGLMAGFINTIKTIVTFFIDKSFFDHKLTVYTMLNIVVIIALMIGIIVSVIKSGLSKDGRVFALFLLCLTAIIPCSCIWHYIAVNSIWYRPMMLTCFAFLYIVCAVLFDRWFTAPWCDAVGVLIATVVFNFALMANIAYFYLDQCYEKTYATGLEMVSRIHQTEGLEKVEKIVMVGNLADALKLGESGPSESIGVLMDLVQSDLIFDSGHAEQFMQQILGLDIPIGGKIEWAEKKSVKEMGIWPAWDSMRIVDNALVIKIAE